ncbi:hypothetical protein B0H39_000869 [Clostridium beijerinckii]|nr:hypothetical protein [Clostridium beijerinckii]NOV73100.1 hypothetical protein [Clostridium beijerinckii]NOW33329.1 hypothetical protein [Clostridium beijerinckii]NOW82988.1 hypothetical protein [Clostridium beijerinckii]
MKCKNERYKTYVGIHINIGGDGVAEVIGFWKSEVGN